jgi:hypothetical protein
MKGIRVHIYPGEIYGIYEVIREIEKYKKVRRFEVKCSKCGKTSVISLTVLRGKYSITCQHCRPNSRVKYKAEDLINKKFNSLTIKEVYYKINEHGHQLRMVKCICDCGKEHHANLHAVVSGDGNIKSCGCLRTKKTKEYFKRKRGRKGKTSIEVNQEIGLQCSSCECFYKEANGYPVICEFCRKLLPKSSPMLRYKLPIKKEL